MRLPGRTVASIGPASSRGLTRADQDSFSAPSAAVTNRASPSRPTRAETTASRQQAPSPRWPDIPPRASELADGIPDTISGSRGTAEQYICQEESAFHPPRWPCWRHAGSFAARHSRLATPLVALFFCHGTMTMAGRIAGDPDSGKQKT